MVFHLPIMAWWLTLLVRFYIVVFLMVNPRCCFCVKLGMSCLKCWLQRRGWWWWWWWRWRWRWGWWWWWWWWWCDNHPVTLPTLPTFAFWGERPWESQFSLKTPAVFFWQKIDSIDKRSCKLNRIPCSKVETNYKPGKWNLKVEVWKFPCLLKGVCYFSGGSNLALGASSRFRCPKGVLVGFRGLSSLHPVGWENYPVHPRSVQRLAIFNHKSP